MTVNLGKSHMWTVEKEVNVKATITVMNTNGNSNERFVL